MPVEEFKGCFTVTAMKLEDSIVKQAIQAGLAVAKAQSVLQLPLVPKE